MKRARAANDTKPCAKAKALARRPVSFAFTVDVLEQKKVQLAGFMPALTSEGDRLRFRARIDELNKAIEKLGGDPL